MKEILPSRRFVPAGSSETVTEIVPLPLPLIGEMVAQSRLLAVTVHSQFAVMATVCVVAVSSVKSSAVGSAVNFGVSDLSSSSEHPVNAVAATRKNAPKTNLKRCLLTKIVLIR